MLPELLIRKRAGRWRMCLATVLLVSVVTSACTELVDPPLPDGAIPFTPLAQYRLWWDATASCSLIDRSFDAVRWYVVPGAYVFTTSTGNANGVYRRVSNTIVLADRSVGDGAVVRHEMLHALLRGTDGHPPLYFRHRCAGYVECAHSCANEPDSSKVAGTVTTAVPSDLELDLAFIPASGFVRPSDGWYMVIVSARNPQAGTVQVSFSNDGTGYFATFGYTDVCHTETAHQTFKTITLAPGETRHQAFDVQWCSVRGGAIAGRGSLGRDSTAVRTLPVQP